LNKNNIIRSIATLALLLLFSLSNTPKQWLHDIFANHKDCTTTISKNNLLISQQGFNCDCDSLVVEVPFTSADKIFIGLPVLAIHSAFASLMDDNFSSVYHFYFELRGPPSVA
jgi:hypothetical protein